MQKVQREPSLFILLLLVSFASVSAVLFTPGLPQIAKQLSIDVATAQSTITVFLIGIALGVLFHGPISDRFGRKPALYLGISVAILGCILTLFVVQFQSLPLLLFGRLLMALGSSAGLKIAFTMVGDIYHHDRATKAITYLMLSFSIAPALAVGAGGFLTTYFGWMSCLYFQTLYSVFLLIMAFFLPETCLKADLNALKMKSIASEYLQSLKNKTLILCGMMMGCGAAVIYLFAAEAPFIGIVQIGMSPSDYGLLNFIPPIGLVSGSLLANLMVGKKSPFSIMLLGTVIACIFTALMFLVFYLGFINRWTLFTPMLLIYTGESFVYANAASLALSRTKNKSYASAMMNFLTIGFCIVTLFVFDLLPWHGAALMPLFFTALALLMLVLLGGLRKPRSRGGQ